MKQALPITRSSTESNERIRLLKTRITMNVQNVHLRNMKISTLEQLNDLLTDSDEDESPVLNELAVILGGTS